MSKNVNVATYHHGDMPIKEHAQTYHGVMDLFKWGALAVADILILLVMWFCTPAGFFPPVVVSIVVLIAGIFFLRAPKTSAH